jgi:hypothetical protein
MIVQLGVSTHRPNRVIVALGAVAYRVSCPHGTIGTVCVLLAPCWWARASHAVKGTIEPASQVPGDWRQGQVGTKWRAGAARADGGRRGNDHPFRVMPAHL